MKRILLITLIFFTIATSYPQPEAAADSLARLLAMAVKADSNRVKLLLEYARCFLPKNPDTAIVISRDAVKISEQISFSYGVIRGLNNVAVGYWYKNNPDEVIPTFHKALSRAVKDQNADLQVMVSNNLGVYYGKLGISDSALKYNKMAVDVAKNFQNKSRYAKAISDLGVIYSNRGNYVEALECFLESKNYYESNHNYFDLEISYLRLGLIFYNINDFDRSIGFFRKSLQINDTVKDVKLKMKIIQNIGLLYLEVKMNFDSAQFYLKKALVMAQEYNDQETILSALVNLGNIALEEKAFPKAISLYNEVLNLPIIPFLNQERAAIYVNLGNAYLGLGDLGKAEMYAKNGIKLAEKQKFIKFERSACKILGDIEAEKKNYKSAFEYYVRYATLQDTLGNEIVKKKMAEVVFQNALNQKESENLLLQKDNEFKQQTIHNQQFLIAAAGVILLLGFILLVVIIRNNRKQHLLNKILDQKNKELKELNLTKDKFFSIIAHDLKGPFNGLLGLLTELDENYDDLDELSKHRIIGSLKRSSHNTFNLLVNLLDWTQSQGGKLTNVPQDFSLHEVTNEVLITLSARAVAKNQNLLNNIKQGTRVNADPQIVQAMLLNLVNNGIKFTPAGGTITVRIPEQENPLYLRVEVADTGVGIPESEVNNLFRIDTQYKQRGTENEPGTGLGLVMCKEYATLLGGEIGVCSEPGIGSVFHFTIGLPAVPHAVESPN